VQDAVIEVSALVIGEDPFTLEAHPVVWTGVEHRFFVNGLAGDYAVLGDRAWAQNGVDQSRIARRCVPCC